MSTLNNNSNELVQSQATGKANQLVQLRGRLATALVTALLVSVPLEAEACDPNCDFAIFAVIGTPVALGTIVVAPLVGLAIDRGGSSRYWQSLGYTALAVGIGWGIGVAVTLPTDDQVSEWGVLALTAVPLLFGSLATYLTYSLSSSRGLGTPQSSRGLRPTVWVVPSTRGGSLGITLQL